MPIRCALATLLAMTVVVVLHAQPAEVLEGKWIAVAAERNGQPADEVKGHIVAINGTKFEISVKGKVLFQGDIKLDAAAKPATIDFQHKVGKLAGKAWLGIYEVAKGKLRICDNAPDISRPRPQSFTTKPDSGYVLVTLERAK